MSITEFIEKYGCIFCQNTKNGNWYISFENDLKDRQVYFCNITNKMYYKKNGKILWLTELQQNKLKSLIN